MPLSTVRGAGVALVLVLLPAGCHVGEGTVERFVDGRPLVGRAVAAEAYAAFLEGAIAEASGSWRHAAHAYGVAAAADPRDAETWSRLGDVRCQADPRDARADEAFHRALSEEAEHPGALARRARCQALRRGEPRLSKADALGDGERLVALTLDAGADTDSWIALARWADASRSPGLAERAWTVLARRASHTGEVVAAIDAMAREGQGGRARRIAEALVDSAHVGALPAQVERLALDAAIAEGTLERVLARTVRLHWARADVAARALLHGRPSLAYALVEPVVLADPADPGAWRVAMAACLELGVVCPAPKGPTRPVGGWPFATWAAWSWTLSRHLPPPAVQSLAEVPHAEPARGDELLVGVAVSLVAKGLLPERDLTPEAAVLWATRRGAASPHAVPSDLDVRYRLLAASTAASSESERDTVTLRDRLLPNAGRDPLLAVACARLGMRWGQPVPADVWFKVAADAPTSALSAATWFALVSRGFGDSTPNPMARARATLAGLAETSAERELLRP